MAKLFISVLLLAVSMYSSAQTSDKIKLEKKLDSIFKSFNNENAPGYAVTIIKDGKVIAKKSYGMSSLEFKVPFDHNTVVTLPYSEGREFISIAAALLEEDGRLKLEDKVRKYFPKLPAWSDVVTLQDLLNHSSGFCDEWATLVLTQASMNNRLDVSQFLNFLYDQPLPQVEPGKGYMYSNSDLGLLRLILDKAAGESLPDYLHRKVFSRLDMFATRMQRSKDDMVPNHAFTYIPGVDGGYRLYLRNKTSPGGNYWILTSANDMEKWAAAHADENSFIAKAVNRLKQHARPIPVLQGTNYVFGHKIKKAGGDEVIAHMGVVGFPHLTRVPSQKLSVICVTNYNQAYEELTNKLIRWFLQVEDEKKITSPKFPATATHITKDELQKYAGIYRHQTAFTFQSNVLPKRFSEFRVIDDSLNWVYATDDIFPIVPVGNGIFKDGLFPLWLVFDQPHPDSVMKLEIHSQYETRSDVEYMKKDTAKRPHYSKEYLQKLTGKYYSPHLDFYWTLILNAEEKLVLKRPTIADKILEPMPDGEFMLKVQFYEDYESNVWIKFYYNDTGEVTHLDVHNPRLMHHQFDKVR